MRNADTGTMLSNLHSTFCKTISKFGEKVVQETSHKKRKRMFQADWHDDECRHVLHQLLKGEQPDGKLDKQQVQELCRTYRKMKRQKIYVKQQQVQDKAIHDLKTNPRSFYRLIGKQGSALVTGFPLHEWYEHGKQLYYSSADLHQLQLPLYPYQGRDVFTAADIEKAIGKMKNNKATDRYDIKAKYFKELKDTAFSQIMSNLFNEIIKSGDFPRSWSEAEARPLHKSGSMLSKDNFTYIMLTSMFYKLYSTAINMKVTSFLQNQSQRFQAGFRKGHSCAHHLFTL